MEKNLFAEKAQQAGISLGELFRRAAASYQTRENDTLLEGMNHPDAEINRSGRKCH